MQAPTVLPSAPKVSILVPIYNVERYLDQCLQSLVNQTLKDIEIICLNDGSTDKSLEIIQKYAKDDPRIVIIDKPNSGYGDSMNQGLKRATGEYIGIVESDDWIELDAFETLYDTAKRFHADVAKANYYMFRTDETGNEQVKVSQFITQTSANAFRVASDLAVFQFPPAIWSGIYRREFLEQNQINFLPTPGASYQDIGFNLKVWLNNPKVVLLQQPFLHYRLDNESSSVNNPGKINCVVDEYAAIDQYIQQLQPPTDFIDALTAAKFGNYYWNYKRLSPELAKTFFITMRRELLHDQRAGHIKRPFFSSQRWIALQLILKYPRLAQLVL